MSKHTDDIRNVVEGDKVTITTTTGLTFDARCTEVSVESAAPETGEIRRSTMWSFSSLTRAPAVSIIDGLRSSPDDPEFPIHKKMYDRERKCNMGYIESVKIHGTTGIRDALVD